MKSYFALTISVLAVDVCQPITALLQGLPEETARACVQHQLPVDATEVLLAVLRIPTKIFFSIIQKLYVLDLNPTESIIKSRRF